MIRVKILGQLTVEINNSVCTPTAPKVRQVLALLMLRGNTVLSLDSMIGELWGDNPPCSAVTTAQTYVYQLRKLFARYGGEDFAADTIQTVPAGYLCACDPKDLDYWRFEQAVARARTMLGNGSAAAASTLLSSALGIWSGPALLGVDRGTLLEPYAAQLEEERICALELRLRSDMELGRHRELIAELKSLVMNHPYNEWMHAQLMTALHRSGRRGEALAAYQRARRVLRDDLGLEPSEVLQEVHQTALHG